jgi:hypothetical protein
MCRTVFLRSCSEKGLMFPQCLHGPVRGRGFMFLKHFVKPKGIFQLNALVWGLERFLAMFSDLKSLGLRAGARELVGWLPQCKAFRGRYCANLPYRASLLLIAIIVVSTQFCPILSVGLSDPAATSAPSMDKHWEGWIQVHQAFRTQIFLAQGALFFVFLRGAQVSCTYLLPPTTPLPHPNP